MLSAILLVIIKYSQPLFEVATITRQMQLASHTLKIFLGTRKLQDAAALVEENGPQLIMGK